MRCSTDWRSTSTPKSGNILKLSYPGAGTLLETTPEKAGLLDLAYPLADFEPFRLGSEYSTGAKVEQTKDAVTITLGKARREQAVRVSREKSRPS